MDDITRMIWATGGKTEASATRISTFLRHLALTTPHSTIEILGVWRVWRTGLFRHISMRKILDQSAASNISPEFYAANLRALSSKET